MQRNTVQDVLPPEKKSIRDIPIPLERRRKSVTPIDSAAYPQEKDAITHTWEEKNVTRVDSPQTPRKRSRFFLWISILIALLVLIFAFSVAFGSATVFVTPKVQTTVMDSNMKAEKSGGDSVLAFEVVTLSKTGSRTLNISDVKQVDAKASGKIIVYNNEATPQTLIKNTRFESSQGLIYRISNAVSVPAKAGTNPGSIEVSVIADAIGSNYNIGLSDFTIPGFKGDPKFKTVYAKSKTAMTGGSSSSSKGILSSDRAEAEKEIEADLSKDLLAEARSEMPENFILFDSSATTTFEKQEDQNKDAASVIVSEKASFHGILFSKASLEKAIAKEIIAGYDNSEIHIEDFSGLVFSPLSSGNLWEMKDIIFNLKGPVSMISAYNEEEIKQMIAGQSIKDVPAILEKLPSVEKVEIVIKPIWKNSLPGDPKKITIVQKKQ